MVQQPFSDSFGGLDGWSVAFAVGPGPLGWPRLTVLTERRVGRGYRILRRAGTADWWTWKLTLGGCGELLESGRRSRLPPGEAICFRADDPELEHRIAADADHWRFLRLSFRDGDAAVAGLIARHGHRFRAEPDRPSVRRLRAFGRRGSGLRSVTAAESASLVWEILAASAASREPAQALPEAVAAALDWMTCRLEGGRGIADCADDLGIHSTALARSFKAALGISPAAWLRRERLRHAAALLAETELPIGAIARRLGYAQEHHFARALRRAFGCQPRELRAEPGRWID